MRDFHHDNNVLLRQVFAEITIMDIMQHLVLVRDRT